MGSDIENGGRFTRFIDNVIRITLPFVLALLATAGGYVLDHERRLAEIEGTRYTIRDSLNDDLRRSTQLAQLTAEVLDLKRNLPKEIPPSWLLERVRNIEKELERFRARQVAPKKPGP